MLQMVGLDFFLPVEQQQPAVQVVGQHHQLKMSYGSGTSSAGLLVHSGPARISSSKILPCVSSCSLFTPSALASDSLRHTSCSGSYCEGAGLDGRNLSSR